MIARGHLLLGRIMWDKHAMADPDRCVITCNAVTLSWNLWKKEIVSQSGGD
jgi:hypothetical protein